MSRGKNDFLEGVAGELCYVKNGKMNNYAMDMFTVPVKSSINTLHFIWQSKDDTVKVRDQVLICILQRARELREQFHVLFPAPLHIRGQIPVDRSHGKLVIQSKISWSCSGYS
jgi:WIF domain